MPVKREPCRHFQRGSCQFGERCRYLHVVQQQPKPSNPFGFGSGQQQQQQQQQSSNPFGFGTKQQQFKPFENKWSRSNPSDNGAGRAPSSTKQQPDSKTQAANHTCTDPESCKRSIAEDFEHERPIWKLTCYGHARSGPCDIVGDISYEELRAAAYEDAKQGMNVQSIVSMWAWNFCITFFLHQLYIHEVERERNLSNTKLVEFQNLLQTPYVARSGSAVGMQNLFPGAATVGISPTGSSSGPPQVSSFSQLGPSLNTGFAARPSGPVPNNVPNQPNAFSSSFPTSNQFGVRSEALSAFMIGPFGVQLGNQQQGSSFPSNVTGFPTNSAVASGGSNVFPSQSFTAQNSISFNLNAEAASNLAPSSVKKDKASGDKSIWSKESWRPGEIPEEAPAEEYVY
ncbi:Zinc finger CCCH domain-containing protein 16 [Linum grandiflorum]